MGTVFQDYPKEKRAFINPEDFTKQNPHFPELCVSTFKDKPSMTRLIDNLEKLNCVQRVASQADRRINIIKLTPRGRELEQESKPLVFSVIREALTDITQEDITVAYHVLIHIFENLRSSLESK